MARSILMGGKHNLWYYLQKFCDETSIHGLRYINGFNVKHHLSRITWLIIFLVCFGMMVWQCWLNVLTYLSFDVITSEEYEPSLNAIEFPTITFCNINWFQRSIVGNSDDMLYFLTALYFAHRGVGYNFAKNKKYCQPYGESNFKEQPLEFLTKFGIDEAATMISINSTQSVVKCWWGNKDVDCKTLVYDHFTDNGPCFTINPEKKGEAILTSVFGINLDENIQDNILDVRVFGSYSGLQLLLNVHTEEYCGTFYEYIGPGFKMFIHGKSEERRFLDIAQIGIYPGKSYDVAIRPIKYIRNTESLDLCKKTHVLPNINVKGRYFKSICYELCYFKFVAKKCDCLPVFASKNIENVNKILSHDYDVCYPADPCFTKQTELFTFTYQSLCTECPPPCAEMRYQNTVSEKEFPTKNMLRQFKNISDHSLNLSDIKSIKKNYLFLNMYFESMTVQKIEVSQKFTLIDLFIFMGGNIGLFLGMSLMSLFEPLYELMFLLMFAMLPVFQKIVKSFQKVVLKKPKRKVKVINIKVLSRDRTSNYPANVKAQIAEVLNTQLTISSKVCRVNTFPRIKTNVPLSKEAKK